MPVRSRAASTLSVLLLTACARPPPEPAVATARLELLTLDAEVWSTEIELRGRLIGAGQLAECAFEAGGQRHAATAQGDQFSARFALSFGENLVVATCRDLRGRALRSQSVRLLGMLRTAPDAPPSGDPTGDADARGIDTTIVYGVVPTVYATPPDVSPLARVTAALDGLKELGVTTLWLSPIFATPSGDFGYAVTDFLRVREDYGSPGDLDELVRAAHNRGLRVLLDLVVNHSSSEHRYFREAEGYGERSHYYSFYARDGAGTPTHYFDWTHLPNLNYEHSEVSNWVLAFSSLWVRDHDVDGYRVDAAWGVRQRAPEFFPRWSAVLRQLKPELTLLAEATARDPYYLTHGFHLAYDWTEELGHHAWEKVFAPEPGIARRLAAALAATAQATPHPERTFRFLNNNDTGKRFITRHGEALTRVATAALLTLPGVPCLFALDELGAEFEPYGNAPPVIAEHPGLREFHRRLIELRKRTPALHAPGYRLLAGGESNELFAFLRYGREPRELALVALNFSADPLTAELQLPSDRRAAVGKRLRESLTGVSLDVRAGRAKVALAPWEAKVFVPP